MADYVTVLWLYILSIPIVGGVSMLLVKRKLRAEQNRLFEEQKRIAYETIRHAADARRERYQRSRDGR